MVKLKDKFDERMRCQNIKAKYGDIDIGGQIDRKPESVDYNRFYLFEN